MIIAFTRFFASNKSVSLYRVSTILKDNFILSLLSFHYSSSIKPFSRSNVCIMSL